MMLSKRWRRAVLLCALAFGSVLAGAHSALAMQDDGQDSASPAQAVKREDIDLEIHVQLLIASNKAEAGANIPASLEPVARQVRASMHLPHYRLGPTFLHRVKSGRNLEVKGTGGLLPLGATASQTTPTFYNFTLRPVEVRTEAGGRSIVNINDFRIGMRVPVVTSGNSSSGGHPVIQYEDTGILTGLSIREGEPVVVGSIYVGSEGDAVVVVLTAKRINMR